MTGREKVLLKTNNNRVCFIKLVDTMNKNRTLKYCVVHVYMYSCLPLDYSNDIDSNKSVL